VIKEIANRATAKGRITLPV
jgi:hypothetical protein